MAFTKDQEKMLKGAGYSQSQRDSNRWTNGGHSAISSSGGSVTWNTDRNTKNGSTISNTDFKKKAW